MTCGTGSEVANRSIVNNGTHCPPLTRTRACTEKPCAITTLKLNRVEAVNIEGYPLFDPYGPGPSPPSMTYISTNLHGMDLFDDVLWYSPLSIIVIIVKSFNKHSFIDF